MPYRAMWAYWYAMEPVMTLERLSTTRAMRLAQLRDPQQASLLDDREQRLAFPEE